MNPYSQFSLPQQFDFELSIVRHLQDWQVLQKWEQLGKPALATYGLDWYGGEGTDGRRSVDDRHSGKCFRVFYLEHENPSMFEKRCCILAHKFNLHLANYDEKVSD